LNGIELPCGLVPVGDPGGADPDRYAALVTTSHPPEEVGPALADELERLGYVLFALSDDEAVARRADDLVSLRIHPHAPSAQLDGVVLFPTAPTGSVAVELWAGGGPHPRRPR
jgi:hypothetical protein